MNKTKIDIYIVKERCWKKYIYFYYNIQHTTERADDDIKPELNRSFVTITYFKIYTVASHLFLHHQDLSDFSIFPNHHSEDCRFEGHSLMISLKHYL